MRGCGPANRRPDAFSRTLPVMRHGNFDEEDFVTQVKPSPTPVRAAAA
jgi:hypothetical protein